MKIPALTLGTAGGNLFSWWFLAARRCVAGAYVAPVAARNALAGGDCGLSFLQIL